MTTDKLVQYILFPAIYSLIHFVDISELEFHKWVFVMLNDFQYEKHVKFYTVESLKVLDRVSSTPGDPQASVCEQG